MKRSPRPSPPSWPAPLPACPHSPSVSAATRTQRPSHSIAFLLLCLAHLCLHVLSVLLLRCDQDASAGARRRGRYRRIHHSRPHQTERIQVTAQRHTTIVAERERGFGADVIGRARLSLLSCHLRVVRFASGLLSGWYPRILAVSPGATIMMTSYEALKRYSAK